MAAEGEDEAVAQVRATLESQRGGMGLSEEIRNALIDAFVNGEWGPVSSTSLFMVPDLVVGGWWEHVFAQSETVEPSALDLLFFKAWRSAAPGDGRRVLNLASAADVLAPGQEADAGKDAKSVLGTEVHDGPGAFESINELTRGDDLRAHKLGKDKIRTLPRLQGALILGDMPIEEGWDIGYGGDPRTAQVVRTSAKMKIQLFSSRIEGLISGKVKRSVVSRWVARTAESVAKKGDPYLAHVLTTWYSKASEMFKDDASLGEYITEYLEVYKGRGFPVLLDSELAMPYLSGSAGPSLTQADVDEAVGAAVRKLEKQMERMQRTNPAPKDLSKVQCHYCKEFGHVVKNCPKKKAELALEGDGTEDQD